jgi:GT2 family glycosyltransferase
VGVVTKPKITTAPQVRKITKSEIAAVPNRRSPRYANRVEQLKRTQIQHPVVKSKTRLHPTMSVVICASGDRYAARVHRCLDSVHRQVGVRLRDIEVILMIAHRPEDQEGSKKLTRIAEAYGAKVVREAYTAPGYNYAFARNAAVRHCRGAVLCFLDADVILDCATFKQAFKWIDMDTFVLVLCAYTSPGGPTDIYQSSNPMKFRDTVDHLRVARAGMGGCIFIPESMYRAVNGWDEVYVGYGGPDQDLCFRLKQAGFNFIELTAKTGIKALHQWHRPRARDELDMNAINKKRLHASREGQMLPKRNPSGYGGLTQGVTVLVAHHPLRPVAVLEEALLRIGHATKLPVVVDLYVQGPCELPDFSKMGAQINLIQQEENQGMVAPRIASLNNMLERGHTYWGMVDDNALIPQHAIDDMIEVLDYERDRGEYNVGCVQLANNKQATSLPVGIRLSEKTEKGLPILEFDRCAIAQRKHNQHKWAVGDIVGSGHSVYSRAVFESGVFPDSRYYIGFTDYDMCLQMHIRGFLCALLTSTRAKKVKEGCYFPEYNEIRRNKKIIWEGANKLAAKWGVVLKELG